MMELLFFLLGLVIGNLSGITVMCIFQINRLREEKSYICEDEE